MIQSRSLDLVAIQYLSSERAVVVFTLSFASFREILKGSAEDVDDAAGLGGGAGSNGTEGWIRMYAIIFGIETDRREFASSFRRSRFRPSKPHNNIPWRQLADGNGLGVFVRNHCKPRDPLTLALAQPEKTCKALAR